MEDLESIVNRVSAKEHVILLHGLLCGPFFMNRIGAALRRLGYVVHNVGYSSRAASIAQLADEAIGGAIRACEAAGASVYHFVTHSMGGILVRSYLHRHPHPPALGRVVMLAPPNHGSEVVDAYLHLPLLKHLFRYLVGAAGVELSTGSHGTPERLGPADFELGILAGCRSWNCLHSIFFLSGENDGEVTVKSTRLEGMQAHRVLLVSHTFIVSNKTAIREVLHFLSAGKFSDTP
jgi:pimeloyl-ACP methyl ester carboxylesterase